VVIKSGDITTFSDTTVVSNTTYTYQVIACDFGVCSTAVVASTYYTKTDFSYDELGRVIKVTDPANANRDYKYDPAGNRTSVTTGN
jgi:YD repeat-containing protein